jgi:hypothetical protein
MRAIVGTFVSALLIGPSSEFAFIRTTGVGATLMRIVIAGVNMRGAVIGTVASG